MTLLRLQIEADGTFSANDLPLRMPRASGVIDPEPFRARARGEGPALAEDFAPSSGMRTLHLPGDRTAALFDIDGPVLTFVLSGGLRVASANRADMLLEAGSLLLTPGKAAEAAIRPVGDCRLLQVLVAEDWPGPKARPVETIPAPTDKRYCRFQRMVKHADDRSYFHSFPELFGRPGAWSALTPLVGLRFIAMDDKTFIDWHPEIVNNLVVVMAGGLELEVGGGADRTKLFRPGDVCLAQDRTGQGHIDRVHGAVQVAVLIVEDRDLWPLTDHPAAGSAGA